MAEELSLKELRAIAAERGLKTTGLKKNDLLYVLSLKDDAPSLAAKTFIGGVGNTKAYIERECLIEHGIRPVKQLHCGGYGCSYHVCQTDNCAVVIKSGTITETEISLAEHMSSLGLGPVYLGFFDCPIVGTDKMTKVIVMEKLDLTLSQVMEAGGLNETNMTKLKELLLVLIDVGIKHADLHTDNVMAILDDDDEVSEWRLIDFGESHPAPINKIVTEATLLFFTMLSEIDEGDLPDEEKEREKTVIKDTMTSFYQELGDKISEHDLDNLLQFLKENSANPYHVLNTLEFFIS
jgi:hypothetical protein